MDEKNNSNSLFICIFTLAGILISIKLWSNSNKINTSYNEILWEIQKTERFVAKNDNLELLATIYSANPDLKLMFDPSSITQTYQYYLTMSGKAYGFETEEKFNQELYSVKTIQDYSAKVDISEIDKVSTRIRQKINETSKFSSSQSFLFWLLILIQILNMISTLKLVDIESSEVK